MDIISLFLYQSNTYIKKTCFYFIEDTNKEKLKIVLRFLPGNFSDFCLRFFI